MTYHKHNKLLAKKKKKTLLFIIIIILNQKKKTIIYFYILCELLYSWGILAFYPYFLKYLAICPCFETI